MNWRRRLPSQRSVRSWPVVGWERLLANESVRAKWILGPSWCPYKTKDGPLFAETFAERGYLVVERLFDPALIGSVYDEYRRQYDSFDSGNLPLHMDVGDRRLHLPIKLRGPLLDPNLHANPLLLGILANLFHTPFLIDSVTCVTALPGAKGQRHHRDHSPLFSERNGLATTLPPYAVTVAIPLIDLDPVTGTTGQHGDDRR